MDRCAGSSLRCEVGFSAGSEIGLGMVFSGPISGTVFFSSSDQAKVSYVMASSPEADCGGDQHPYLLHGHGVCVCTRLRMRSAIRGWALREIRKRNDSRVSAGRERDVRELPAIRGV